VSAAVGGGHGEKRKNMRKTAMGTRAKARA
jgi:hypothetical protein